MLLSLSGGPPPPPPPPLPTVGSGHLKKQNSDASSSTIKSTPGTEKRASSGSGPFGFDPSKVILKKTGIVVFLVYLYYNESLTLHVSLM